MHGSSVRVARDPLEPRALAVTRRLLMHGPASRGTLGRELSLSEASMSRIARSLLRDGLITETQDDIGSVGRPRQILTPVPQSRHVVGVKLTADTAYGVACNLIGDVLAAEQTALPEPVERVVPLDEAIDTLVGLVRRLATVTPRLDGLGVSVGGVVDQRTLIREGTFLGWRDIDLGSRLHQALDVDVVVTNDLTALAREELWFGAGRDHATFGVMTVGAGIGFAVVREGAVLERLIDNGHLMAHAPIDTSGPACGLGHRGCVSAYLDRSELERRHGDSRRPWTLAAAQDDPSPASRSIIDDGARALGHAVATFAGALQTNRIVLAGEDVAALASSPVMNDTIDDRLRPGPAEAQRCRLDVTVAPLTFTDWARGAAVTSVQHILGSA